MEPAYNWRGSMMAQARRDPIFWATMAVTEQDFAGAGDLCIRCHSADGWLAGRSTPTDGSGLAAGDADGVECDTCHKTTNPNNGEHLGVQNAPFMANNEQTPATGYYGGGMTSMWGGRRSSGPIPTPTPITSSCSPRFHRSVDFCGTCHDVSNPVTGDLAHNNGKQPLPGRSAACPAPVGKAAFNNFPYQYGVVERTFSEYKAGRCPDAGLELRVAAGQPQDRGDRPPTTGPSWRAPAATTRTARPGTSPARRATCRRYGRAATRTAAGAKGPAAARHDRRQLLDARRHPVPGHPGQAAPGRGPDRRRRTPHSTRARPAQQQLDGRLADRDGNTLSVANLTGHKLISGYPEGRRMWLNIKWYDAANAAPRGRAVRRFAVTIDGAAAR